MNTITTAIACAVRLGASRVRHGRPLVLAGRLLAGLVLAEIVLHSGAGLAAVAASLTGIITWLGFTIRGDFAPPPGR
jgi:hypothetical protein